MSSPAARLRALLEAPGLLVMPCCFDAWSARLVEAAGFPLTFMSGFAVAAAPAALPDTGLLSYGEMLEQGREICSAVSIPVIGDADTGYGNPLNVKRTIHGYARAGFACAMIEDQRWPKRCGHVRGKEVVERDEALARIRAAVEARRGRRDPDPRPHRRPRAPRARRGALAQRRLRGRGRGPRLPRGARERGGDAPLLPRGGGPDDAYDAELARYGATGGPAVRSRSRR